MNLERRMGLDFLTVQKEIEVHFIGMLLAACLFLIGILCFLWNFWRYGLPSDEALHSDVRAAEQDTPTPEPTPAS